MATYNTFLSPYSTGKQKENLLDKINVVSNTQTPGLDMMSKGSTPNPRVDWLEQSLLTGQDNAFVEGVDFTVIDALSSTHGAVHIPTRHTVFVQYFEKSIKVTDPQEKNAKAAVKSKSEIANEAFLKGAEMKTDVEHALFNNFSNSAVGTPGSGGGTATTAPRLTDFWHQIDNENKVYHTSNNLATGTDLAWNPSTGINGVNRLDQLSQTLWDSGALSTTVGNSPLGSTKIMAIMSSNKKYATDNILDDYNNNRRDIGNMEVLNHSFTTYIASFGTRMVLTPSAFTDDTRVGVFSPMNHMVCTYEPMRTTPISKIGRSERRQLGWSLCLVSRTWLDAGSVQEIVAG